MSTEYTGAGDVTRSMELLWGTQERPSRGPKPTLTLDRIVDAAIELADAQGVTALSMRQVAAKLDVGTMSLYRYVPSKAELLDVMFDRVQQPIRPDPADGWREGLRQCAESQWHLFHRHPWLLQVSSGRPLLGPNALRNLEILLTVLAGLGLTDEERLNVIVMVDSFVAGLARTQIEAEQATERTGTTEEQFWAAQQPFLVDLMLRGDYPEMAALDVNVFAQFGRNTFEFGLERVLDGIEDMVERRA
jgi:AcrR family transcriptional regulator